MAALGLIRTRVCRYWSGPKPHDNDAPGADAQYVSTSGRRDGNIDQVVTANARRKFGGLIAQLLPGNRCALENSALYFQVSPPIDRLGIALGHMALGMVFGLFIGGAVARRRAARRLSN